MKKKHKCGYDYDAYTNHRSIELFGVPAISLNIGLLDKLYRYIYDLCYPEWKPVIINGIDTGYQISNTGEVKGKRGKILEKDISNTGYYVINGYLDGKQIKIRIHREVARAFIPNDDNKPFVNHLNGNKQLNWYGNLEWATHDDNMKHAVETGLIDAKGIKHPENVYSNDQVIKACKMLEDPNNTIADISRETGINRSILYGIRTGHTWTHISSRFQITKPPHQSDFNAEKITNAAKLILDGDESYASITRKTGIPYRTLRKILMKSPKYAHILDQVSNS